LAETAARNQYTVETGRLVLAIKAELRPREAKDAKDGKDAKEEEPR